jgi:hypothetical protein
MDPNVEGSGARVVLARIHRFAKATAALWRNTDKSAGEIFPDGSAAQVARVAKSWRLARPPYPQGDQNLALDAQVRLWIERTHRGSSVPNCAKP